MDEKLKILEMIENGKITAKEGMDLISALEGDKSLAVKKETVSPGMSKKYLKIRVDSDRDEMKTVNVNIPLRVAKLATKFMNLVPKAARDEMAENGINIEDLNLDEIIDALEEDMEAMKLVDVKGDGVNVDIYIE
ncbi:MAG TPA: hypothetical protein DDZ89_11730 [Clostridiales bacterium]|nr:hypothetical protein [Clostridiales bacterium]